jgi:hypothetical protein
MRAAPPHAVSAANCGCVAACFNQFTQLVALHNRCWIIRVNEGGVVKAHWEHI